jgi:hypothetical protein
MTIHIPIERGADLWIFRVKLPKSFLAVNLSESHTFHKKESPDADDSPVNEKKKSGELVDKNNEQKQQEDARDHLTGN